LIGDFGFWMLDWSKVPNKIAKVSQLLIFILLLGCLIGDFGCWIGERFQTKWLKSVNFSFLYYFWAV
jgi:hypothetical protein